MTKAKIVRAVIEAKRFQAAAKKVLAQGDSGVADMNAPLLASRDNGSLKRASQDLSRSLVEMRKTW